MSAADPIRPLVALVLEDDPDFRVRFERLLDGMREPALARRPSVTTIDAALGSIAALPTLDLLVTDLGLPDGLGHRVVREVATRFPHCAILVVTVFGDEENIVTAIEAGAQGYLLKDSSGEEFISAVRDILAGGSPISPIVARLVLNRFRQPAAAATPATPTAGNTGRAALSERETEILRLVAKGFNFTDICGLLDISMNTVKTHVHRIYRKLAVHSRGEAVYEASRLGLIDL
jgi:DNA-binding NarL/FixJ family response regulator